MDLGPGGAACDEGYENRPFVREILCSGARDHQAEERGARTVIRGWSGEHKPSTTCASDYQGPMCHSGRHPLVDDSSGDPDANTYRGT